MTEDNKNNNIKEKTYDQILDDLYKEHDIENLLNFNETDIKDKLALNSAKLYHYTEMYQKSLSDYNSICEMRDKLIGMKYIKYKNGSVILTKGEIEKYYLPADEEIIQMNARVQRTKAYVDFFENVKKALERQGWNFQVFLKTMTYGM